MISQLINWLITAAQKHPILAAIVILFVVLMILALKHDKVEYQRKKDIWSGKSRGYMRREIDRKRKQDTFEILAALAGIIFIVFLLVSFWNHIQSLR